MESAKEDQKDSALQQSCDFPSLHSKVEIRLEKRSSDIMLTFDGQEGLEIDDKDTIVISKGPHPVHMITLPDQHYFDVLKAKLRWSGGRG